MAEEVRKQQKTYAMARWEILQTKFVVQYIEQKRESRGEGSRDFRKTHHSD